MQIHIPIKGTNLHREVIEQQKEDDRDPQAISNASSLELSQTFKTIQSVNLANTGTMNNDELLTPKERADKRK